VVKFVSIDLPPVDGSLEIGALNTMLIVLNELQVVVPRLRNILCLPKISSGRKKTV
jgi:hypothetical protein